MYRIEWNVDSLYRMWDIFSRHGLLGIYLSIVKRGLQRERDYNIVAHLYARSHHLLQREWRDYPLRSHPKPELRDLRLTPSNSTTNFVEGRNRESSTDDMKSFNDWNAASRYRGFCMQTWRILRKKLKSRKSFWRRFASHWIRAWLRNNSQYA